MQNKLEKKGENNLAWREAVLYGESRGGWGINKQTLTRAAVEDQAGEQRGLRSGADSPVWEGGLPSTDPELRHSGAAWLH